MAREALDLYTLDALANDIEGFEDVVRLVNHPTLGWQSPHGGPIPADAVLSALHRLVAEGLVEVLTLDPDGVILAANGPGVWPSGEALSDLWFRPTLQGKQVHAAWQP